MYKRDLITSEIQKLAEVLARIMGLKHSGKQHEADELFAQTLEDQFGLTTDALQDESKFISTVEAKAMPVEKLDMLSQFLFNKITDGDHENNKMIAIRLNQLFAFMEKAHRTVSLEHMHIQQIIKKYL